MPKDVLELPDLFDLMAMAKKNKETALLIFKRQYDSVPFVFSTSQDFSGETICLNDINNTIEIKTYKYFKKFLNTFGHLLSDLRIEYDDFSTFKLSAVFDLICKHCTSLKALQIDYDEYNRGMQPVMDRSDLMTGNPLRITSALPSLESLIADNVYFKANMKMNKCFPNLKSVSLLNSAFADSSVVEAHMPTLTNLNIVMTEEMEFEDDFSYDDSDGDTSDGEDDEFDGSESDDNESVDGESEGGESETDIDIDDENIQIVPMQGVVNISDTPIKCVDREITKNVIRLNPQLESVKIEMDIDMPFIEFLRDTLPSLQKLTIALENCDFNDYNGDDIVFKNVTVFNFDFLDDVKRVPPITSECLNHLILSVGDNAFAFDFIKKHRSLKTLDLECNFNAAQVLELFASLPDLKNLNLTIEDKEWSPFDMNRILTACKRFNKARIMVNVKTTQRWRSVHKTSWKIYEDFVGDNHIFEKRSGR